MIPADDKPKSLLAGGAQGELFDVASLPDDFWIGDEQPEMKDGKTEAARYTAERFFSKRPEDYKACVALLAAGAGLLKIARLLHVHHETVAAVRDREGAAIDIQKERIKRNIRLAVEVGSERLPEIMGSLPGGQVPIATAVLIDKIAQLDGEPTQRIEVTHKGHLTHAAVQASLEAFPEGDVVEITGSRGRESDQKAGTPPPALDRPASDNQSTESTT
jgi:hypothetical protein